tara:strand:+ start:683 stop:1246 length:564 start_codon:yes stop_codon:yes gene_type:complete
MRSTSDDAYEWFTSDYSDLTIPRHESRGWMVTEQDFINSKKAIDYIIHNYDPDNTFSVKLYNFALNNAFKSNHHQSVSFIYGYWLQKTGQCRSQYKEGKMPWKRGDQLEASGQIMSTFIIYPPNNKYPHEYWEIDSGGWKLGVKKSEFNVQVSTGDKVIIKGKVLRVAGRENIYTAYIKSTIAEKTQ